MKKVKQMKKCIQLVMLFSILTGCATTQHQTLAADDNIQLGLAYLQKGDRPLAKEKLLLALQESPEWPAALDAMGYFYETTGENTEAEKYYLSAIKVVPKDGAALNNYGTFLCRDHRPQEAEKMFIKAAMIPDYLNTASAYQNAGLCALTIPDKIKAKYYFQKAQKEDPTLHE